MLKRYYTLQEAADYLGEKTEENRLSVADVLELVGDGKARLCAEYSGYVISFWRDVFGSGCFWARRAPFHVRGYFCVAGSETRRIGRATKTFRLMPTAPVEIKEFDFARDNLIEAYKAHTHRLGEDEPTKEQLLDAALHAGIELPETELGCYLTRVEFGGFISGSGWPEVDETDIDLDACLIPKDDLDAILSGGQPDETSLSTMAKRHKDERYAVTLKKLNLHAWPLIKGDCETLYNAVNKSLAWVKEAIKSNDPKLVYPAQLAILLQQENNGSSLRANPEVLRRYLAENFPYCLDDYEAHIDFGKDDVT